MLRLQLLQRLRLEDICSGLYIGLVIFNHLEILFYLESFGFRIIPELYQLRHDIQILEKRD